MAWEPFIAYELACCCGVRAMVNLSFYASERRIYDHCVIALFCVACLRVFLYNFTAVRMHDRGPASARAIP